MHVSYNHLNNILGTGGIFIPCIVIANCQQYKVDQTHTSYSDEKQIPGCGFLYKAFFGLYASRI